MHLAPQLHQKPDHFERQETYRLKIVWKNVAVWFWGHITALYGVYLIFTSAKILTTLWAILLFQGSMLGITAGAHRLWAHRSYKAKWPLKLILITLNSIAFTNHVYEWVRDHRVHHKYSDTDADPHNAKRGLFFSHVGWALCRKHPDVIEKGRGIDLKDLEEDQIVQFQKRHFFKMVLLFSVVLPLAVPVYFWGETWSNAWHVAVILRYAFLVNMESLVNSVAHYSGKRPYDRSILPTENLAVAFLTLGEGWHNYHHTFPWDYKTGAPGSYFANPTAGFIDFFSTIGWAYDMKTAPPTLVQERMQRTGTNVQKNSHVRDV